MTAPQLITVGIDGSAGGRRALAWAVNLAVATRARIEVVSAWSWDAAAFPGIAGSPDVERTHLAERQQVDIDEVLHSFDGPKPTVSRRLIEGQPARVLIEAAHASDLLVLGSHGRGHLHTVLLGSVSESCIRHGTTPIAIIPSHERDKPSE